MPTYTVTLSGAAEAGAKYDKFILRRQLGAAAAMLEIECHGFTSDHVMDTVEFEIDGTVYFAGVVKSQEDRPDDTLKRTTLKCVDNTDKLQRRIVAENYLNKTILEMLTDLQSNYATWMTLNNVQNLGAAVDERRIEYTPLGAVIQNLADEVGAYWFLDQDDDLHFFTTSDGAASYNYAEDDNILSNTFSPENTAMALVNRIWIIGAKAASASYIDQYWTGDGDNDRWPTWYVPNYPEVTEGGVVKTIEVEKGEASSEDYTYDKKNKVLKRVAGALGNGVSLQLHYRPTVQVIDYFEDQPSIAAYGLYEKVIRDRKIIDKASARKRGRAELKKVKASIKSASFRSLDWDVVPGQLTTVTVADYGFSALPCHIETVTVTFLPADIEATITVREATS